MSLLQISNVLFDLDGTLTDPKEGITRCIQYALDRLGLPQPPKEELLWCIGPPLKTSFSALINTTDDQTLDQAVTYYRERFAKSGIFENRIYPEVPVNLKKLHKAGFNLFLSTSKPSVFAHQILEFFNLTKFFKGIYGSELDGRLSDKTDLIAHILKQERRDPNSSLMVGDRIHDIVGGRANGLLTAMVTYGYGTKEEINEANPDYTFDSPNELTATLQSS